MIDVKREDRLAENAEKANEDHPPTLSEQGSSADLTSTSDTGYENIQNLIEQRLHEYQVANKELEDIKKKRRNEDMKKKRREINEKKTSISKLMKNPIVLANLQLMQLELIGTTGDRKKQAQLKVASSLVARLRADPYFCEDQLSGDELICYKRMLKATDIHKILERELLDYKIEKETIEYLEDDQAASTAESTDELYRKEEKLDVLIKKSNVLALLYSMQKYLLTSMRHIPKEAVDEWFSLTKSLAQKLTLDIDQLDEQEQILFEKLKITENKEMEAIWSELMEPDEVKEGSSMTNQLPILSDEQRRQKRKEETISMAHSADTALQLKHFDELVERVKATTESMHLFRVLQSALREDFRKYLEIEQNLDFQSKVVERYQQLEVLHHSYELKVQKDDFLERSDEYQLETFNQLWRTSKVVENHKEEKEIAENDLKELAESEEKQGISVIQKGKLVKEWRKAFQKFDALIANAVKKSKDHYRELRKCDMEMTKFIEEEAEGREKDMSDQSIEDVASASAGPPPVKKLKIEANSARAKDEPSTSETATDDPMDE